MRAVFATDLSDASKAALDCLCACETGDFEEVVLLHVIDVDMYTGGGSVPLFLEADKALLEEQAARLRGVGLEVRTRVELGDTVAEIERVAAEESAGLVIVGNVGRGGLRERALGGTAERVASEAKVPVLVERVTDSQGSWCRLAAGHTFRKTAIAVDFSPASRSAIDFVGRLSGVEAVRLVHVVGGEAADGVLGPAEDRRLRLDEWALAVTSVNEVSTEVLEGDPATLVNSAATAWGATCIATGLCGHGHAHRLVWGSVSSALARLASLPVLLVPPET